MAPRDWRLWFSFSLPAILLLELGKQIPLREWLLQEAASTRVGPAVEGRSWVEGVSLGRSSRPGQPGHTGDTADKWLPRASRRLTFQSFGFTESNGGVFPFF